MKPSSKYNRRALVIRPANRVDDGSRRYHTGAGPLIVGKPSHGQTICFTHQTAQHICHCDSADQIQVSPRTRIPRKGHQAAWDALRRHLQPLLRARRKAHDELTRQAWAKTVPGYAHAPIPYRRWRRSDDRLRKAVS